MTLVGGSEARLRLLVTGSSGQLGRELLLTLPGLGDVTATDRDLSKIGGFAPATQLDICDDLAVDVVLDKLKPHVIVNAAGYRSIDGAERHPHRAYRDNAEGPETLAKAALRHGAALIHFSSACVFNGTDSQAWTEDAAPDPLNVYGRSKLAGEEAIRAVGGRYLIVRTGWLYGLHGDNFVYEMLAEARRDKVVRAVAEEVGVPTSAEYLAETTAAIVAAAAAKQSLSFADLDGRLHINCRGEATWPEIAEELIRLARRKSLPLAAESVTTFSRGESDSPTARPRNTRLDVTRLRTQFGIEPPTWQNALARSAPAMLDSFRTRHPG